MNSRIKELLDREDIAEYPMVFIKSVTRLEAQKYYGQHIPVLITDGIECYKIENPYLVSSWEGILFVSSINA